jgi:hypothetical protein
MTATAQRPRPRPRSRLRRSWEHPIRRPLLTLSGFAVICLACLIAVGGWAAGGVGLIALLLAAALLARFVLGAEAFDGSYRREIRLVHEREPSLHTWVSNIEIGRGTMLGFERALRPQLERLYAVRLAENHGVSLYHEPDRAAALIGPRLWPWINPQRPGPHDSPTPQHLLDRRAQSAFAPPPDAVILALIDRLEEL